MPDDFQPTPCPRCGRAGQVRPKLHAISVEGPLRFADGFYCAACGIGFLSREWLQEYEMLRDFGPLSWREWRRFEEGRDLAKLE